MTFCCLLLVYFIFKIGVFGLDRTIHLVDNNDLEEYKGTNNIYNYYKHAFRRRKDESIENRKVSIHLYYATLCPYSLDFYTNSFVSVVEKLGPYLNITTNPYGIARTLKRNGKYIFTCQHGPEECYGNKLHACATEVLQSMTEAVLFNSCMMKKGDSYGSNDKVAEKCSKEQYIDAEPIKECAMGAKGTKLLKEYGDANRRMNVHRVPWVFINGHGISDRRHFMRKVCAAYKNPPLPCQNETK